MVLNVTKLLTESSLLEIHIKPYIDAANTDNWKHILRILYLNGSVLEAHENFRVPCLISRAGSIKKVKKSMDFLSGKSKARITPLIIKAARMFLPKLLKSLFQAGLTEDSDADQLNASAVNAIISIVPELERQKQTLMGMMIDGAFTMADLVAVWFFKGLSDMRNIHILSGISENDYENMIDGLRRLDVIEPKLHVSICPECMNYELTISRHPFWKEMCPRCGTSWTTLTLYMFERMLGDIKSKNSDLPLFVSSYLKFRLSSQMLVGNVEIFPKAEIDCSVEGKEEEPSKVEIDVYIPNFNIGIECKTFEAPLAPMTTERANGIVGDLMKQLRKYVKAGISEFFLITNLPEKRLGKIQQSLEVSLRNAQIPLQSFEIIPGDIGKLLNFLNSLADRSAKHVWKGFEESLKKKVPKPVEEIEVIEALDQKKEDAN